MALKNNETYLGRKWHSAIAVLVLMILSCGFINLFGLCDSTHASTLSLNINTNVLSMDIMVTSALGNFAKSNTATISVSTDSIYGYTLGIRANSSQSLVGQGSASGHSLTSISSEISETDFSSSSNYNNQWGYSPSYHNSSWNYITYYPAPTTSGEVIKETSCANGTPYTDCEKAVDTYTLRIGARANNVVAAGEYSNTFTIYALAYSIQEYMQDFTDKDCGKLAIGEDTVLHDNRDEKEYTVARLGDGLCWMTSDLRVGSTTEAMTLTSENTDITGTFNLPILETTSTKSQWGTSGSTVGLDEAHGYQYSSTKTFYNWYTATGGTTYTSNNATTSICPAGWKLPTATQANDYLSVVGEANGSTNTAIIRSAPLKFLPNYYNSTSSKTVYSNLYYWLATGYQSSGNYLGRYFGERLSNGVYYVHNNYGLQKMMGVSVRCVHASDQSSGFKIYLDSNGGSGAGIYMGPASAPTILNNLPTPTRSGFTFAGWYTDPNDGEEINNVNLAQGTKVYYAHWTSTITLNFNGPSSLVVLDPSGNIVDTVSSSGGTVGLRSGTTYTIRARRATLSNATIVSGVGTLGSINVSDVSFTAGDGAATISLTGTAVSSSIQNYSLSTCSSNASSANRYVYDSRDENIYSVRYINGECWMTQNLRLMGTVSAAESNFTGNDFNVSEYSLDSHDSSYTGHCTMSASYNNACAKDSNSIITGSWYNYYALSVGTISTESDSSNLTVDICPSGWHVPTGPNTTTTTDFYKLVGNTSTSWQAATTGLTAFGAVAGGNYYIGSLSGPDYGYWWSAGAVTSAPKQRYVLAYNSSNSQFRIGTAGGERFAGFFIRCVRSS